MRTTEGLKPLPTSTDGVPAAPTAVDDHGSILFVLFASAVTAIGGSFSDTTPPSSTVPTPICKVILLWILKKTPCG